MIQSFDQIKELGDCKPADQRFRQMFTEIVFSLKSNFQMIKTAFHLLKLLTDGTGNTNAFGQLEIRAKETQKGVVRQD